MNKNLQAIKHIADGEYSSVVEYSFILDYKLRIILVDKSFIDVNISTKLKDKFEFTGRQKINLMIYTDTITFPILNGVN